MTGPNIDGFKIDAESGVSLFTGEPFCQLIVTSTDGETVMRAQCSPTEMREQASMFTTIAEASVHDAALFKLLRERLELDEKPALQIIADLRNFRADMPH